MRRSITSMAGIDEQETKDWRSIAHRLGHGRHLLLQCTVIGSLQRAAVFCEWMIRPAWIAILSGANDEAAADGRRGCDCPLRLVVAAGRDLGASGRFGECRPESRNAAMPKPSWRQLSNA